MIDIGIRYYSSNPHSSENEDKVKSVGILDKYIKVSEIDENVLKFIDIDYVDGVTMSFNIDNKHQCNNIIKALEIIKNNLT